MKRLTKRQLERLTADQLEEILKKSDKPKFPRVISKAQKPNYSEFVIKRNIKLINKI